MQNLSLEKYQQLYAESISSPETFWRRMAEKFIFWHKPFHAALTGSFTQNNVNWFQEGKLNATYNCLDRHLKTRSDQVAIIWEGDDPAEVRHITYAELFRQVCVFANALKKLSIKKNDCVCIYMPMIPEACIAMLACARLGVPHMVVFAGFSAEALKTRIEDAGCNYVITANESLRGGKRIPLKENVDLALKDYSQVKNVIVVARTENQSPWHPTRDVWFHEIIQNEDEICEPEIIDANDVLFVLYTSGSTGQPKGIVHSVGGYLVYAALTYYFIFDYHDKDIYWCTADIGWITGHTYLIYGPLLNGATTVMFEGVPHYPNFSRYWEIIDKHQVNIFYTAPTAIRALRKEGDKWVKTTKRNSLKILGTVGEPINPDVWEWYYNVVGEKRCPVVDTWWQTETGGIMISAIPHVTPLKAGAAAWPFFGIVPEVVDDKGNKSAANLLGKLIIKHPWPGMMKTVLNDPERFKKYFSSFPPFYFTGDEAKQDIDGYYWILGRDDDVLKISGHRLGTGEIESALLAHRAVSEAAVVGIPDKIKGQGMYAFITLKTDFQPSHQLKNELISHMRKIIGPIAKPDFIQWASELPKTRSGKIMRRLLRQIANNDLNNLGDITTLNNPQVIESLIKDRLVSD